MAIVIQCQCGASFRAKDDLAGKQVRCPKCQSAIPVPGGPARDPQTPLSLDDMMRLAEASQTPGTPPYAPPGNPQQPSGFIAPSSVPATQPVPSSGRSPLIIGLAVGGSLLFVAVGIAVVLLMMRASPTSAVSGPSTQAQNAAPSEAAVPTSPPEMERVKATSSTVGTKGKDYGGGLITEPLSQRWKIEYKLILQFIEYDLTLFYASEGRYPASQEEFMEKIIAGNMRKLPDLPQGQRYVYLPATHELMVERPKQAAEAAKE